MKGTLALPCFLGNDYASEDDEQPSPHRIIVCVEVTHSFDTQEGEHAGGLRERH
jgi:hypothetical protein